MCANNTHLPPERIEWESLGHLTEVQELILRHATDPRVEVILDRRVGPPPAAGDSPNRRASGIERALDADGFAVILR